MCESIRGVKVLLGLCLLLTGVIHDSNVLAIRVSEQKCLEYIVANTRKVMGASLSYHPIIVTNIASKCSYSMELIVNGEEANKGEFPHQALLGYTPEVSGGTGMYTFRCGGSLISDRFVLTAAHCGRPKIVFLAKYDLRKVDGDEQDFDVEAYIRHPQYKLSQSYHDIALVKLDRPVLFNFNIRPACLWTDRPLNLSTAIATGFGKTSFVGNAPKVLMKVRLEVRDKPSCEDRFDLSSKVDKGITDELLCFGSQQDGKDTCHGDSGGPLQIVLNSTTCMFHIVGVTGAGLACGGTNTIGIYTQVASYIDWIESHVWPVEDDDK